MPSPKIPMHHPDAGSATTTEAALEAVWRAKGWRKRPIKSTAKADGYDAMTVADLKAEIDARNEGRDEVDRLDDGGKKADLIAALEADDLAEPEGDEAADS